MLLGLLLVLNTGAIVLYQGVQAWRAITKPAQQTDPRARLPNYEGIDWAETHFEELKRASVEYHSFYGWRRKPFFGRTITVDDRGIRTTPGSATPEDSAPFVVFLGGSTMWGEGTDDNNTIPAHFLRLDTKKMRVENLGESAYNAFQGYLFLKFKVLDGWTPDLVVSYDGINNVEGLCRAANRATGHSRELQMRSAMRGLDQVASPPALTAWYFVLPAKELIARFVKRVDPATENPYRSICGQDLARAKAVAKHLLDSWLSTMQLVIERGGRFVAVLQPSAYVGQATITHFDLSDDIRLSYQAVYSSVRRQLNDPVYAALQPHVVDFTDAFNDYGHVYIDPAHVSPEGNKVIADKLFRNELISLILSQTRSRQSQLTPPSNSSFQEPR